ncbi:hypothetical protein, partial [Streptococcus suis]|uniref:hypothetical protein n=1 Tax=Streptococcus suis TaxID=1307 RepID=UPI002FC611DD
KIPVWASPNNLTSGTLVINELVALDLTTCEENINLTLRFLISKYFNLVSEALEIIYFYL